MSWLHVWNKRGHIPKTLVTEAGTKLDCAALAPWLRKPGTHVLESSSGLIVELDATQVDEEGAWVRSGHVTLPSGRRMAVSFRARNHVRYHHRRHWYGLCGACGRTVYMLFLELGEVPVCHRCGRIRYLTESVGGTKRSALLAFKAEYGLNEEPLERKVEWRIRRAAALRVTRSIERERKRRHGLT